MTESRVKPPPPSELADRLHSAAIRFLRRVRRADADAGLTGPQGSALSVLVFGGETTPGRLAAIEQVSAPTISRLIKELEAGGPSAAGPTPPMRAALCWSPPRRVAPCSTAPGTLGSGA